MGEACIGVLGTQDICNFTCRDKYGYYPFYFQGYEILSSIFLLTFRVIGYILNKSENATLQLSIFCEKVLDKKYLLKLNNVSQTSSKRIVQTPPNCLV